MPYYAMVVVVQADDETRAHDLIATAIPDADTNALQLSQEALFIGDPWGVVPASEKYPDHEPEGLPREHTTPAVEREFDTQDCIDQRREA